MSSPCLQPHMNYPSRSSSVYLEICTMSSTEKRTKSQCEKNTMCPDLLLAQVSRRGFWNVAQSGIGRLPWTDCLGT